jgi:hypothetical protein
MSETQVQIPRRDQKKYGLLNLYIYTRAQCLQALLHSVLHSILADLWPRHHSLVKLWHADETSIWIQHILGQTFHPRRSQMPAPSEPSGSCSCLLCGVEVQAFPSLGFFLLPSTAANLFTVPSGPRQLLCVCAYNLLFCCWCLIPSCWLLHVWVWRDQTLDLLCTDGNFIWLEPPLEMFQGARKEQKARVSVWDLADSLLND